MSLFKIDNLAVLLNRYPMLVDNKIQLAFRNLLDDSMEYLTPKTVEHSFVKRLGRSTSFLQAYQPRFIEKGEVFMGEEVTPVRKMSLMFKITQEALDTYHETYMNQYGAVNTSNTSVYEFIWFLYTEFILEQWQNDLASVVWNGEYVAPTLGVAGATLNAVDGLHIRLKRAIARGLVAPHVLGVPTEVTIVDQMKEFCLTFPKKIRTVPLSIYMSPEDYQMYLFGWGERYKSSFMVPGGADPNYNTILKKRIIPCNFMTGSHRWICTSDENMISLSKKGQPAWNAFPQIDYRIADDGFALTAKAHPWAGFGFQAYSVKAGDYDSQIIFCNEQN
jgi:hypothetical protein